MEDLSKTKEGGLEGVKEVNEEEEVEENGSLPTKVPSSTCVVERSVFDIPENYVHTQAGQQRVRYSDDELLQMAILRSQLDSEGGSQNEVRDFKDR